MAGTPARDVLARVAAAGARDAGDLPVELLGDFLVVVSRAVQARRPLSARQLAACRSSGEEAARRGVALRALIDLHSSSAWRLWRHLPVVQDGADDPESIVTAGEVMLRAVDDAIAALAEGFQLAQHDLIRAQESARRELVDDLLTGGSDVHGVVTRARGFGLDLAGPHGVAVVRSTRAVDDSAPVVAAVERALRGRRDAGALVTSKEGRLVVVVGAPDDEAIAQATAAITRALGGRGPRAGVPGWQLALSRARLGADGVRASYREALEVLEAAQRLALDEPVLPAREVLVYLMLVRDRAGLADLVETVLGGLRAARGGAGPLVETLAVWFGAGGTSAQAARVLHLSVRAVTYRLDRVRDLTGYDPADPRDHLSLHVAVVGARLLGWPMSPRS
jgi:hypothetical protein